MPKKLFPTHRSTQHKWMNPQNIFTFALSVASFFVSQLGLRGTENASCLGHLKTKCRMLQSVMHLAQMDTQIKSCLCKTDAHQCFESVQSLHISVFCWISPPPPSPPPPPPQSVPVRPNSVMSRLEWRWPILDSVMGVRIVQHVQETHNTFRQKDYY